MLVFFDTLNNVTLNKKRKKLFVLVELKKIKNWYYDCILIHGGELLPYTVKKMYKKFSTGVMLCSETEWVDEFL